MDNKITKKRLSHILSYDWFAIVAIIVVSILAFSVIFGVLEVKLTTGQLFKYYYDENIASTDIKSMTTIMYPEGGKFIFSYDVIEAQGEYINSGTNNLSNKLDIQEGDVIISHIKQNEKTKSIRANSLIDDGPVYSFEELLRDAKGYLTPLLKDGVTGEDAVLNYDNIDENKVRTLFLERMKKDNRFRKDAQKAEGQLKEIERIKTLVKETADLQKVIRYDDQLRAEGKESIFYDYTRFKEAVEIGEVYQKEEFTKFYEQQKSYNLNTFGKEELRMALKMEKLNGGEGKKNVGEYFRINGQSNSQDVVLMIFNFKPYQEHLQYETITLFNEVIRNFSTILDN